MASTTTIATFSEAATQTTPAILLNFRDRDTCTNQYGIPDRRPILFSNNFPLRTDLRSREAIEDSVNDCLSTYLIAPAATFSQRDGVAATWDVLYIIPPHDIPDYPQAGNTHVQLRVFYDATTDKFLLEVHRMEGKERSPMTALWWILKENLGEKEEEMEFNPYVFLGPWHIRK